MKNKQTVQKTIKLEDPKRHLITGADLMIKHFKSPAKLLEFTTYALSWLNNLERHDEKPESNFITILMIRNLVQPWFASKDITNKLAEGLEEISDYCCYEGFIEHLGHIMKALGMDLENGYPLSNFMDEYLSSLSTIYTVGCHIGYYEEERKIQKDNDKFSKAA